MVDALRILFSGVVSPAWASNFDWAGWRAGARELPADHATIARQAITGDQTKALSDIAVSDKAVNCNVAPPHGTLSRLSRRYSGTAY